MSKSEVATQAQRAKLLEFLQSREKIGRNDMYGFVDQNYIRCPTARISELRQLGHIIEFDNSEKVYRYKGMWNKGQLNLLECA
jgi:hypothetical protein